MSPILESPQLPQAAPVSLEMYHQMGEYTASGRRTELIRGIVIEKMSKSPLHASMLRRFFRLVSDAAGSGLLVCKEDPLTFIDSEPEPDVSVVVGDEEDYKVVHPTSALLVIEIAVTSEELDRAKAAIYAEAGVQEYWIVLAERAQIEAYTFPREGVYTQQRRYSRGETLVSLALPNLSVELEMLFHV